MVYTVIINGQSYDLPAKNLKVMEQIEQVELFDAQNVSIREKYKKVLAFVTEIIGKDNVKEAFGTDSLDKMDLNEVTLAYLQIKEAYDKPIADYRISKGADRLNDLPLDQIAQVISLSDKIQK